MKSCVIRTILVSAVLFVLVLSITYWVRANSLQTMRTATLARLDSTGGTDEWQATLARIREYVQNADRISLSTPHIVATDRLIYEDGFGPGVDWVSLSPIADSVHIVFQDGASCTLEIFDTDKQ